MHPPNPLNLPPPVAAPLCAGLATTWLSVPAHGLARPPASATGERAGNRAPRSSTAMYNAMRTDGHPPRTARRMQGRDDR